MNVAASVRVFHEPQGAGGGRAEARAACGALAIVPYLLPQRPCAPAQSYFWPGGRIVVCCSLGPSPLQNELDCHPFAMGSCEFWGWVCSFLDRKPRQVFWFGQQQAKVWVRLGGKH